jgi:hypothetical protein
MKKLLAIAAVGEAGNRPDDAEHVFVDLEDEQ